MWLATRSFRTVVSTWSRADCAGLAVSPNEIISARALGQKFLPAPPSPDDWNVGAHFLN
jgi:hypothetical protein